MNVTIKKTQSFKNPSPINSQPSNFTPTKRFQTTSPALIISSAKNEFLIQESAQKSKKPLPLKTPGHNNIIKTLKSPLTATEPRSHNCQFEQGLERIREVKEITLSNEKKIRRFTEELETASPNLAKNKDVILDLVNIEEKSKIYKMKRGDLDVKSNEEKKKQDDEEFEDSKNSVNSLQKSFRIRSRRSTSDIPEKSVKVEKSDPKQVFRDQKRPVIPTNITNKHLLHNKMQRRPDTTGAKNREKKFVIIEKNKQMDPEPIKKANTSDAKITQEMPEKTTTRPSSKREDISQLKEKFKEEFIEKMKVDMGHINHNNNMNYIMNNNINMHSNNMKSNTNNNMNTNNMNTNKLNSNNMTMNSNLNKLADLNNKIEERNKIQMNDIVKTNDMNNLNENFFSNLNDIHNTNNNPLDIKKEFSTDLFDEFKFGELLGEGAYAQVFKVLLPKKGNFIAVKVIKLIKGSDERCAEQLKGLRNEINLLQRLNHPHIVSYLGCKQQQDNFYIFMEHLSGGSISSMLKQYGRFDEQVIRKFVRQLLSGLEYLHSQKVVHSDLKGANILSDGCGNVKLADFGASRHLENLPLLSVTGSSYMEKSAKGSLYWMAPEILNQEKHGRKVDIWGLGCTVIEMASAKHPWPDCKSFTELVVQVMTVKCPPIPENLSEDCKDFIRKCCIFDKTLRPTAKELFSHSFLRET